MRVLTWSAVSARLSQCAPTAQRSPSNPLSSRSCAARISHAVHAVIACRLLARCPFPIGMLYALSCTACASHALTHASHGACRMLYAACCTSYAATSAAYAAHSLPMRRVRNSERTACRMRCMRSTASSPSCTETTKAKSLLFSARIVAFSKSSGISWIT